MSFLVFFPITLFFSKGEIPYPGLLKHKSFSDIFLPLAIKLAEMILFLATFFTFNSSKLFFWYLE